MNDLIRNALERPTGLVSAYRFPPYLDLYAEEEVVEGELLAEIERAQPPPETVMEAELVEDPAALEAGAEAEVPDDPADVTGPEPEQPAGVRVAWKRPTELFAEAGARVTARGMDLTAALFERARGAVQSSGAPDQEGWVLAPMDPFGQDTPLRSMPAPDVISRD